MFHIQRSHTTQFAKIYSCHCKRFETWSLNGFLLGFEKFIVCIWYIGSCSLPCYSSKEDCHDWGGRRRRCWALRSSSSDSKESCCWARPCQRIQVCPILQGTFLKIIKLKICDIVNFFWDRSLSPTKWIFRNELSNQFIILVKTNFPGLLWTMARMVLSQFIIFIFMLWEADRWTGHQANIHNPIKLWLLPLSED